MHTSTELNALLAAAKYSEQAWTRFKAEGWRREGWHLLYKKHNEDRAALYKALDASLPVCFIAADGKVKTIGTLGLYDQDFMVRYSREPNAKIVCSGYRLSAALEFFKPSEQPTTI